MALSTVNIDENTWEHTTDERRIEWEANIREFLNPDKLEIRPDIESLDITVTEQQIALAAKDAAGNLLDDTAVPHNLLSPHIHEYVDTVRQIAIAEGVARLEALDMAKKVSHDRAGRFLKRHFRELRMDLTTARRLFTLLLSLRVDTTRLVGIHGHRRIR